MKRFALVCFTFFACLAVSNAAGLIAEGFFTSQRPLQKGTTRAFEGSAAGGVDLVIDTVTFGSQSNGASLTVAHNVGEGVDGVCVVAASKDSGLFAGTSFDGVMLSTVVTSPRASGFVWVQIWCGAYTGGTGSKNAVIRRTQDGSYVAVATTWKGMDGTDLIHSSATKSDITASATSISTSCLTTVTKNILISGLATAAAKDITEDTGDVQIAEIDGNAITLSVAVQDATGSEVAMGGSWTGGERAEQAIAQIKDDPAESP